MPFVCAIAWILRLHEMAVFFGVYGVVACVRLGWPVVELVEGGVRVRNLGARTFSNSMIVGCRGEDRWRWLWLGALELSDGTRQWMWALTHVPWYTQITMTRAELEEAVGRIEVHVGKDAA